jgi:hypothetical protein
MSWQNMYVKIEIQIPDESTALDLLLRFGGGKICKTLKDFF